MDDRTVGLVLRALRRRRGWRQSDLAARAGCSQALVSLIERGHVAQSSLETVRHVFQALDARVQLAPTWRGAELERLLDSEHAAVSGVFAGKLERARWTPMLEVTYSEFGERGSIDVLGLRADVRAAVVGEVKTDVASSEAVARKLDEKGRLVGRVVRRLEGWTPEVVALLLVLPESPRLRRLVTESPILSRLYPVDARRTRAWLREPAGSLRASWFLSDSNTRNPRRVRAPSRSSNDPLHGDPEHVLSVELAEAGGRRTILR